MNRILVTGDTHGSFMRLSNKRNPALRELDSDDYLIICGDVGLNWCNPPDRQDQYNMQWLQERKYNILWCCGNHENFTWLKSLPSLNLFGNDVGVVADNIYHLRRGRVYNIAGRAIFSFGGALSIDKVFRKEGVSWWPEEYPNDEEIDRAHYEIRKCGGVVDYVISHTCPTLANPWRGWEKRMDDYHSYPKKNDLVMQYLQDFADKLQFQMWYFGHMHINSNVKERYVAIYEKVLRLGDYHI